jgi:hypothetical protein
MNIKKIIREEIDDFDWITNDQINLILNKAFYFDPPANNGDVYYEYLTDLLIYYGFTPKYSTPLTIKNEKVIGLYTYVDSNTGKLAFVYTTDFFDEDNGDYEIHIREFAKYESVDKGNDLILVDAREFISSLRF